MVIVLKAAFILFFLTTFISLTVFFASSLLLLLVTILHHWPATYRFSFSIPARKCEFIYFNILPLPNLTRCLLLLSFNLANKMESVGSLCESLSSLSSFHINDGDEANRTRGSVLAGNFNTSDIEHAEWKEASDRIVVFVSSTFVDTMGERNIMLKSILPDLQKKGREEDIQVQFVDMRYGLKDDSTLR